VAIGAKGIFKPYTSRDVIDLLDGFADSGRVVTANRVRRKSEQVSKLGVFERDISNNRQRWA